MITVVFHGIPTAAVPCKYKTLNQTQATGSAIMFLEVVEVAALDHDRNCRYHVSESVGSCVTRCDTRVSCAAIRIFTVSIISDPNNFTID
jgi:hypothetical protein